MRNRIKFGLTKSYLLRQPFFILNLFQILDHKPTNPQPTKNKSTNSQTHKPTNQQKVKNQQFIVFSKFKKDSIFNP